MASVTRIIEKWRTLASSLTLCLNIWEAANHSILFSTMNSMLTVPRLKPTHEMLIPEGIISNVKCVISILQHLANWKNIFVFVCLFTGIFMFYLFLNHLPFSFCILPQSYIPPVLGQAARRALEKKKSIFLVGFFQPEGRPFQWPVGWPKHLIQRKWSPKKWSPIEVFGKLCPHDCMFGIINVILCKTFCTF